MGEPRVPGLGVGHLHGHAHVVPDLADQEAVLHAAIGSLNLRTAQQMKAAPCLIVAACVGSW